MKKLLILLISLLYVASVSGQMAAQNITPDARSKEYHLYKITAKQGLQLATVPGKKPDSAYFQSRYLVSSADSALPVLPQGHYLKVAAGATYLNYFYYFITGYNLYLLDNSTDLLLQLRDKYTDSIIADATIQVAGKHVPFDPRLRAYRIAHSYDKGLLQVNYGNDTFFYNLSRTYDPPRKGLPQLLYRKPFRYVAVPVYIKEHLPVDALWSVQSHSPRGSVQTLMSSMNKLFRRRNRERNDSYGNGIDDFFFFSKPKYRTGDTIRFNVLLLDRSRGQWLDEPLVAVLQTNERQFVLDTLRPSVAGGGYHYSFKPVDSFNLKLDRDYTISLRNRAGATLVANNFHYEEYELKKAILKIEGPGKNEQIKGNPLKVRFTAKDENGLPMPEAKAEVFICRYSIENVGPARLFVPDTIARFAFGVEEGTKTFEVNDSILPDADMTYTLKAFLRGADFERTQTEFNIRYRREKTQLGMRTLGDKLLVDLWRNDTSASDKARLLSYDVFNNLMGDTAIALPYEGPLNTHVGRYECLIAARNLGQTLYMEQQQAQLDVRTARDAKQIALRVVNPRNLSFTWQLYKTNKELERGQGRELDRMIAAGGKEKYYIQLQYVWAGKAAQLTYEIPLPDKLVTLAVAQPDAVYPGKEATITVTALDYRNKPVKGMNIFTYGLTGKFDNVFQPTLPYFGKAQKSKSVVNNFRLDNLQQSNSLPLDYERWRKKMHLESLYSYRFLYPSKTPEIVTLPTDDSSTQVAPFVVSNGMMQPVRYVLLDKRPVYFGFTDVKLPYSFLINDTNYHQLAIQTSGDYIFIDSLKVQPHAKSIFSIDVNNLPANVHRQNGGEYMDFSRNVLSYNTRDGEGGLTYIRSRYDTAALYILPPNDAYNYQGITFGPLSGSAWTIGEQGVYEQDIDPEPYFTYQVQKGLVKMIREHTPEYDAGQAYLAATVPSLNDFALNPQQMRDSLRNSGLAPLDGLGYFEHGPSGSRSLQVDLQAANDGKLLKSPPLYYVLRNNDPAFIRISTQPFGSLNQLPAGDYELMVIGAEHTWYSAGMVTPVASGYSYYRAEHLTPLSDKQLRDIDSLLFPHTGNASQRIVTQRLFNYFERYSDDPQVMITGTLKSKDGFPLKNAWISYDKDGSPVYSAATDGYGQFVLPLSRRAFRDSLLTIRYYYRDGSRTRFELQVRPALYMNMVLDADSIERKLRYTQDADDRDPYRGNDYSSDVENVTIYERSIEKRAVSNVMAEEMSMMPVSDMSKAISGARGIAVASDNSQQAIMMRGMGSLSASGAPLIILNGAVYAGSFQSIDPSYIETVVTLKNAEATALYGDKGTNGVIVITTKKGVRLPSAITAMTQPAATLPEVPEDLMASGLRSRFSDEAFWQPALITDKDGKVSFKVTFPDDITSWKTFVYATDDRQHTGQTMGIIRSFKPLSASLSLPHFVVAGDSVFIRGKSVQYGGDTLSVTTAFYRNDTLASEQRRLLRNYALDSLLLHPVAGDSVRMKFLLKKDDGYFDGEEKTIPVLGKGTAIAQGAFICLDSKDTLLTIPVLNKDTLHLTATASLIDILADEVKLLKEYKYLCNEQLSSKILATLTQQRLYTALQKPFDTADRRFVQDMVDLLCKRQQGRELWGWWADGAPSLWISARVIDALTEAKKMNYKVGVDFTGITRNLIRNFEVDSNYTDLNALKLIHTAGVKIDFEKYIGRYERKHPAATLSDRLSLLRLKQDFGLKYSTAFLKAYSNTDIFGNIYWKDTMQYVYQNEMTTTVNALQALTADSSNDISRQKVVNWILQQRKPYGWRNTYESGLIIEALAKYVPLADTQALKPVLTFSGGLAETVRSFPYQKLLVEPQPITLQKSGAAPVYFTYYQRQRDTSALPGGNQFSLSSVFLDDGKQTDSLSAGKPVRLQVTVQADKDAEFVMIDIPIPASCTYQSKTSYGYGNEVHREYFNDHVSIFCEKLPKGKYVYSVELQPRYSGAFTLNPARAELMYFPVFYGREGLKKVRVE